MALSLRSLSQALMRALACALCATASPAPAHDMHGHHHNMAPQKTRAVVEYSVPDVRLVREDGRTEALRRILDNNGRPVVLNFIYTSCTTICPLTSHVFQQLQARLGARHEAVDLVSITIDPENDTPARLRRYAKQFGAGAHWHHYTGTFEASVAAQRAFNVFRGDKMDHQPVTLVHNAPGRRWVRLEGFATANDMLKELPHADAAK
jgi:protein SCO1/2